MRAIWLLLALGLTVASAYLTWYGITERRADAPETFVELVQLLTMLCLISAALLWRLGLRKAKQ